MKNTKIVSVIILLVFIFTLVPFNSAAAENTEDIVVKVLVEPSAAYNFVGAFSEGLAYAEIINGDDYKCGYIDKTGKTVIPFEYDAAYSFSEGLAVVTKDSTGGFMDRKSKWGVIDKTGKVVIEFGEYDYIGAFSDGLAPVFNGFLWHGYEPSGGKWGYIDKTGKLVIPLEFDVLSSFSEGLAVAKIINGDYYKCGYIDKMGKIVIPIEYDAAYPFQDGLAGVLKDGKWNIIDKTGKVVAPAPPVYFNEGLASVSNEKGKVEVIDKAGNVVVPYKYDSITSFTNGLAIVGNGTWTPITLYGVIDKTGKEILPVEYNEVTPFSEGLASVKKDGKYGVIDTTGKIVLPLEYEWIRSFNDGVAVAKKDGKNLVIDKTGRPLFTSDWDIGDFSGGIAFVSISKPNVRLWGIIEMIKVGYPIGDVLYSDITAYINGSAIPTSITNGKTMVVVEDLAKYGFDVKWDGTNRVLKVEQNKNKKITPLSFEKDTTHKSGAFKQNYLYTDIKTYLSGDVVESYAIDGRTLIDFELLAKYGKITWDGQKRELRLVTK